jgi:zinc finger protein
MEEEKKSSEEQTQEETEKSFPDLHIDLKEGVPTQAISSLCMNCGEQGETKFMYTKIPFFKEVMISAFCCDECGLKNSEVSFAGKLEDYGCRYEVNVINDVAFNRMIVKSEFATITVPECGLEMPPATQRGSIKSMEGYFMSTIEGLQDIQEERRKVDPETARKIDEYCETLKEYAQGKRYPFKFIVEDPSGNSYVQNPSAPTADQYCKKTNWIRSIDDYTIMGYPADQATVQAEADRLALAGTQQVVNPMSHNYINTGKKQVAQSKEEQEALINKLSTYAKRVDDDETIDAGYMDFSKSVDD